MEKSVRVQTVYDDKYELQVVLGELLDERVTLIVGGKRADARTRCKIADMVEQGIGVSLRFFISRSRENAVHCITAVIKEQKQEEKKQTKVEQKPQQETTQTPSEEPDVLEELFKEDEVVK